MKLQNEAEQRKLAIPLALQNGFLSAASNLTSGLVGLLGSIIIVRSLDAKQYGHLSYLLWLSATLSALGMLAFPHALTKISAELRGSGRVDDARRLERWVFRWLLIINGVLGIGVVLFGIVSARNTTDLSMIGGVMVVNAVNRVLCSRYYAQQRYLRVTWSSMATSLAQVLLVILFAWVRPRIPEFFFALVAPSLASTVILAQGLRPWRTQSTRNPDRQVVSQYVRYLLPASIVLVSEVIVWQRSGLFFLKQYSSDAQIGYFSLAYTFYSMVLSLGWALANGFYPAVSNYFGAGRTSAIMREVRRGIVILVLYSAPVMYGGIVGIGTALKLVYGLKMAPAIPVAEILLVGLVPGVASSIFAVTLNAGGEIWRNVKIGTIMAILNLSLDVLVIPRYMAVGAAAASTATQIINTFLLGGMVVHRYHVDLPYRAIVRIGIAGFLTMYLIPRMVSTLLPSNLATFVLSMVVGGLGYVLLVWRSRWFKWGLSLFEE